MIYKPTLERQTPRRSIRVAESDDYSTTGSTFSDDYLDTAAEAAPPLPLTTWDDDASTVSCSLLRMVGRRRNIRRMRQAQDQGC